MAQHLPSAGYTSAGVIGGGSVILKDFLHVSWGVLLGFSLFSFSAMLISNLRLVRGEYVQGRRKRRRRDKPD